MHTDCKKIQAQISEFLDGDIPADFAWRIRLHTAVCSGCSDAMQEMRATVDLMKAMEPPELSTAFEARLRSKLAPLVATAPAGPLKRVTAVFGNSVFMRNLPLSAGRWAFAGALVAVGLFTLIFYQPLNSPPSLSENTAIPLPHASHPPLDELAFAAACSHEHAQYQSVQPIADPAAQTLAERVDANGAAGSIDVSSVDGSY